MSCIFRKVGTKVRMALRIYLNYIFSVSWSVKMVFFDILIINMAEVRSFLWQQLKRWCCKLFIATFRVIWHYSFLSWIYNINVKINVYYWNFTLPVSCLLVCNWVTLSRYSLECTNFILWISSVPCSRVQDNLILQTSVLISIMMEKYHISFDFQ